MNILNTATVLSTPNVIEGSETRIMHSVVEKKINSFAKLKQGWHFEDGISPTSDSIETALSLVGSARELGLSGVNAFPKPDGSIVLAIYGNETDIELIIRNNNSIDISIEYEIDFDEDLDRNFNDAVKQMKGFAKKLWKSYELSSQDFEMQEKVSVPTRSRIVATDQEYQSFRSNALNWVAGLYAITFVGITLIS